MKKTDEILHHTGQQNFVSQILSSRASRRASYLSIEKIITVIDTIAELIPTHPCVLSFSLGARFGTKISAPGFTSG